MALVQQYGPLENVLEAVPTMPEGRVRRALEGHMEQARLSKWTATIKVDLDVDLPLEGARLFHYDESALRELFDRLEFRSLLPRLPGRSVEEDAPPSLPGVTADAPPPPPGDLQVPGTDVEIVVDAHQVDDAVQRIRAAGAMAVRTVVDGSPRTGDMIGVAFAPKGEDIAYYMPVWHAGLERNADAAAVAALEGVLVDSTIAKRGYDLKRELLAWRRRGVAIQGLQFDALLAAYLTNSRLKVPTLPVLAHDLSALSLEAEETLLGSGRSKRGIADVPIEDAAAYYGVWVGLLDPVGEALARDMERTGATRLHDTMELPLVPILAAMEVEGVAVDCDLLGSISAEMHKRISEIESEVQEVAGYTFNPGSTQQLGRFLYDDLGLASGRKTKTGRSTDADTLEALRGEHPVVDLILEWRQLTKLKSTYVDALPLLCTADSRVHTSFNQAVATTGRLSSSDPNLQNIPVRTQWGQRIRRAFHADTGQRLVSADYS
jgi:DNA polymerase-1